MSIEVVECLLRATSADRRSLDDIVVASDVVAVLDVATPKSAPTAMAHEFKARLHEAVLRLAPGTEPASAVEQLSASVVDLGRSHSDLCATVAVYDASAGHVWRVGDCHILVAGTAYPPTTAFEDAVALLRASIDLAHADAGTDPDVLRANSPGRAAVVPLLQAAWVVRNRPSGGSLLGYGALDGRPVPEELIDVIAVERGAPVVLATDGYLDVRPTLTETEALRMRRQLEDPLLAHGRPTTKPVLPGAEWHDDRAYLRVIAR